MKVIGNQVWFFGTFYGRCVSPGYTALFTELTILNNGIIVGISKEKDYCHVYVDGDKEIYAFEWTSFEVYVFATKQEAIEAMIARLEELRNEA